MVPTILGDRAIRVRSAVMDPVPKGILAHRIAPALAARPDKPLEPACLPKVPQRS